MRIQKNSRIIEQKKITRALPAFLAFAAAALVSGLFVFSPVRAANAAGMYKVKKGDTLWSISGGKLKNEFQWPLIWKENTRIKNPDKIYPGEKINIPTVPSAPGPVQPETPAVSAQVPEVKSAPSKALGPEEKIITPVREHYLFNTKEMISSGFMTRKVPSEGEVISPVGQRALIAKGDDVYIKLGCVTASGDMFLVAGIHKIADPLTDKFAGYLVEPHGIAVVTGENAGLIRATITDTFERIGPGDVLIKYVKPRRLLWDAQGKPSVQGHVLALEKRRLLGGGLDFIYLDKGSADGLQAGDLLQTKKGPDTNALIQIVSVRRNFATAMIKKTRSSVNPGDLFTGLE